MTDLVKDVSEHNVHTELQDAIEAISGLIEGDKSAKHLDEWVRLRDMLTRARSFLSRMDPTVTPMSVLDQMSKRLNQMASAVAQFQKDGSRNRVENALTQGEAALLDAQKVLTLDTEADIGDVQEAIGSFRRTVGQYLRYIQEEKDQLQQEISETRRKAKAVQDELTQQKTRVDAAVAEFQSQYSSTEDRRREQFEELLSEFRKTLQESQQALDKAEEGRSKRFRELEEAVQEVKDQGAERLEEAYTDTKADLEEKVQVFVDELHNNKKEAEKILGAISQTGMTEGFQTTANTERWSMRIWQGVTVAALIGFVIVLIGFLPTGNGEFSWVAFSQRVLVSFGFAGLAAYSARESGRHAAKETAYRKMELEFASVGPFLARLPKEKQDQTLEQIANRTFGQSASGEGELEEVRATTNGLLDVLKMTLQELTKRVR